MDNAQASLLDRLIDEDPGNSRESVQYRLLNVRQVKASVVRDLENLLNSRRDITVLPAEFRELENSVVTYGLKDFTGENTDSQKVRQTIRKDVERTIARFEPRLKNVKVDLETGEKKERNLSFRISAMLVVDPIREPVTFDTFFDSIRKEYVVSD
ncbi:type VI secretion system baseplate subunit TssE [uncultured Desulfosarcina sp.]|uniref:type VI secretion system baseplate subunit TssE n=1 Tax=uncultured Desulfosarcina sp. TaxID=218289 RepID=UPI0029C6E282|nr:type VI secretion system baseplate subunit TssE [uncultured Desulfosarcina sp.]